MIITLVKADFSANNIGLLSTFNVLTNIIGGAVYRGPSSVEKGAALNATIALGSNAELLQMNILMGGQSITDYVVNDKEITISIPAVTGAVLITVVASGNEIPPVDIDPMAAAILHHGAEFPVQSTGEYKVNITGSTTYYIYEDIPVEPLKRYRLQHGRACFFLDANRQSLVNQYVNLTSGYTNWTFDTPANCEYITVAFKYSDAKPEDIVLEPIKVITWGNPVTTLLKDTGAIYTPETAVESGKTDISSYSGFYTYKHIPVTGGKKYQLENCRLSFWSDADKKFISQINFNSNSTNATTSDWSHIAPDNAAYLTVCVKAVDIDKDVVAMTEYTAIEE